MSNILSLATVIVLPSYREGFPRSTQEAMAFGKPIITTDAPGCRESIVDGLNGIVVRPRSFLDLANAMEFFIKNPEMISKMGSESRKFAEAHYDCHYATNQILSSIEGRDRWPQSGS